jgi:predicted transcriptional regulator
MSSVFTLRVPADAQFRGLANDVVARYVELAGLPNGERETVAAAVAAALEGLAAAPAEAIDLACTARPAGFDITVRCGGRSTVVHHPQPAAKR